MNFEQWKNRKPVKEILGDKTISDDVKFRIIEVLSNRNVSNDRIKNLAYWVKYDVDDNYLNRFDKLLDHPKNDSSSKEIFILRYGEIEGLRRFEEKNLSCTHTEELMIHRYGEKKGKQQWQQYKNNISFANSEEGYIKKYGADEGVKRFKKQCERNSGNLSLERKQELYGDEIGLEEYNKMKVTLKERHSLENYIRLYGEEEGTQKYLKICEIRSYKNSLSYYIEKYGEEEGTRRIKEVKDNSSLDVLTKKHGVEVGYELYAKINKKKIHTKENYVAKFGEKDGNRKWKEYASKAFRPFSGIANELFESIGCSNAKFGENEIVLTLTKNEYSHLGQSTIKPDFIINDKIIEFYGDLWHGCDKFYDDDFKIPHSTRTALEQRNHDKLRENILIRRGYKLKIVWEHEYKNDKDKVVKECIDFLNDN